jgi:hypothetical protein
MLLGLPIQYWGIVLHKLPSGVALGISEIFRRIQLRKKNRHGLPILSEALPAGRVPIIGNRLAFALQNGKVRVVPGVVRFEKNGVAFADGRTAEFSNVILATGYRPAIGFPGDLDSATEGLFFVGRNNSLAGTLWHVR